MFKHHRKRTSDNEVLTKVLFLLSLSFYRIGLSATADPFLHRFGYLFIIRTLDTPAVRSVATLKSGLLTYTHSGIHWESKL